MDLATRLQVDPEHVTRANLADAVSGRLRPPDDLLQEAFGLGPTDPELAQAALAAAILSMAEQVTEGRHAGTLALLAPLVAKADPYKTLGPAGAAVRHELMPNGWKYTLSSWERLRYAWREGLAQLLDVTDTDAPIVNALNEITRLTPAEPEPVKVAIQEQWPHPVLGFVMSALGIVIGAIGLMGSHSRANR